MDENDFVRAVGRRIAQARRDCGMTQEQVGEAISIETESVSRIETGNTAPTLKRLHQLARLFHCSAADFLHIKDNDSKYQVLQLTEIMENLSDEDRKSIMVILKDIVKLTQRVLYTSD